MIRLSFTVLFITGAISLCTNPTANCAVSDHASRIPYKGVTSPAYCIAEHNIGRIALAINNNGTFGDGFSQSGNRDCFTGAMVHSCEFPKGSRTKYIFAGTIWVGAVVGRDTLVTVGADGWSYVRELNPDDPPFGEMIYRSTLDPARPEFAGAVSEQDYISTYFDTCTNCPGMGNDAVDNRPHRPLNLAITQRTYAWSYAYAQDFVLFDFEVKNIGVERLHSVYMGIYVDAEVHDLAMQGEVGYEDDVCGFRKRQPALYLKEPCPADSDDVNIAWLADNDGDLGQVVFKPVPNITAARIVRTPSDTLEVSFNWWVSNGDASLDFGPQARRSYRDFGTGGLGTPEGDRNKYHILRNGEFDYDQPRVATIESLDSIWLPPPAEQATIWATGLDTRYILSFGAFSIEPGQALPISLAYVGGIDFHSDPDNILNLPDNPDSWYEGVNFDSLGVAATWAEWIYDNPGVDTDSDGYAGEFTVCNLGDDSALVCDTLLDTTANPDTTYVTCRWEYELADTVWRKGDGVPDFRGATPPPSPAAYSIVDAYGYRKRGLRVEPSAGTARLIWNGVLSENTPDIFSRELDFEGYRVWIGRDERPSSYSVSASYDIENYNRWEFDESRNGFVLKEPPFMLEELRCMYGDSCGDLTWHPDHYSRSQPLIVPEGAYYFEPQDYNRSILADDLLNATTPIKKVYPHAHRPPVLDPDSIRVLFPNGEDSLYLTPEGFIKYYEYEYTFENLLPTVPYWINVTVFDYGSPQSNLSALETSPTLMPIVTYPLPSADVTAEADLDIFVYPNPYRLDSDYRGRGFEGRDRLDMPVDRTRDIHFANLPPRCTIRIHTLDGDLVREIIHDVDPADPLSNHDTWDMITRNSQQPVSGLYYWTVEDDHGRTQIGKLVIIM